jgi:thiamine pyrophosphate-dependent acetolactate synthase large subunit-like protein
MLNCTACANKAIPKEYRIPAEGLFPPTPDSTRIFAETLGIGRDYALMLGTHGALGEFLASFQNNLELLIQKTWVEKAEEQRKEDLLDRLPDFIAGIEQGEYQRALQEFGSILEELAYLFFGAQSHKEDFTEYTFRIDSQMGLFWWYGSKLGSPEVQQWASRGGKDLLLAVLLIGIGFLADF